MKLFSTLSAALLMAILTPSAIAADFKGTFYRELDSDPSTLNPITSAEAIATVVQNYVYDSLLVRSEDTYQWVPALAEKYEISKDGKTFTFTLREGLKWADGKPVTAEDVKYSFDVYFEGRFNAPHKRVYMEGIKEAKIINPRVIQFTTKQIYFKNFDTVAELVIVPKHFYGTGDPKEPKFNKTLLGSGPYKLEEWTKGQRLVLKRNPDYWGNNIPYFKDRYKFDRILFRPVTEEAVALELLKKGDLDFLGLTPEQFMQKTKGPEWGKKVVAVKVQNNAPQNYSYGFVAWNGKNPLFKDRDSRIAMSMLFNRDLMINKFLFGLSEKAVGPFGNKSPATSPKVKPIEFDPKKALSVLEKDGWKLGPTGLTKVIDGKPTPFEFTLLNANKDSEKYWTVVKEDMKKIGITLNIKTVEWNTFLKLMEERKFDAIALAWQVNDLEPDPKQIWHSSEIPSPGHNFIGYSNPKVDQLIDRMRAEMNEKKRQKMLHEIHELIAADAPYTFLFNRKFSLYANTTRIKKKQDTLKYAIGLNTWSVAE